MFSNTYVQVTDGRAVLKDVTLFGEQLRFLLARNDGRLLLDDLPDLYKSTFGSPPGPQDKDWLGKKLIQYAPHVVNLTGQKWVIWAPAGRPYPSRPHSKLDPYTSLSFLGLGQGNVASGGDTQVERGAKEQEGLDVDELVDMEEGLRGRESGGRRLEVSSVDLLSSPHASEHHTAHTDTQVGDTSNVHRPLHQHSEPATARPPLPPLFTDLLGLTPEGQSPPGPTPPSHKPMEENLVEYDSSPYGFLKEDVKLLAQLTVKEEDEPTAVSTEEALQQLLEAGSLLDKPLIPDLPPPLLPAPSNSQPNHHSPNSEPNNASEKPRCAASPQEDSSTKESPTDYLKAGMNPHQVLQELYRVKDSGGGVIDSVSMDPFLSYFGELSSRELKRLEAQEARLAKPFSPSPTSKGMLRKKRMMAIRFPGQDPDPSELDPELQKTLASIQFPELSGSSEDEFDPDAPVVPLSHDELVEQVMKKHSLLPQDQEDD